MIERLLLAAGILLVLWAGWCLIAGAQRRLARPRAADLEGSLTLLYFHTPTCGPCQLLQTPILETLAAEWKEAVTVRSVDVTADPEAAARYRVWTVPTTMWVDASGTVRVVNNGVATAETLRRQWLQLRKGSGLAEGTRSHPDLHSASLRRSGC
ncbi:thioredoxin family protein [Thermoflexus sp.]|uniref:thioredoxin family protein n=1 Tax=Thermoflexus sp. TaxID=1969742 RepID=UPI0035E41956